MSIVLIEGKRAGCYIIREANGKRSFDTGTVLADQTLVVSQLVGIVTASGKYAKYDPTATDGTEIVAGISDDDNDATGADLERAVFLTNDAEVDGNDLVYHSGATDAEKLTANTELKTLGIKVRKG